MILPLQWNRDSYYVARHILDTLSSKSNLVKKHLEFTFKRAWRGTYSQSAYEPVSSAWARSYYANGMPKDTKAFQLDQQIYPLLEFADYVQATHDIPFALEYLPRINEVLEMLTYHYAGSVMVDTDETPADDDIPLPLHFSSHVLLWHTLKKLVEIYSHRNLSKHQHIGRWINELVHGIRSRFITVHQGKKIYAYAASKEDQNYYFYHDANDIPLVMMPLWGFCDKDDEIWLNTIEFAFSDANPGFFDGVLGSVHTPAPWSLGDAQELIFCKVIGDKARYERVWQRVEKAAQWDGALPEAYDAKTGEVVSRHWFAWTNAMIAIADGISWNWETEGEYAR
ncbi:MAG: glycoside hydrolase family 125 protein, partial [Aggregatilineales bacterium]